MWGALSLEPVQLTPAFIMVLFQFTLLLNRGGAAGLSHLFMAAQMTAGCMAGGALGLGAVYSVWAINSGSYEGTAAKASTAPKAYARRSGACFQCSPSHAPHAPAIVITRSLAPFRRPPPCCARPARCSSR